MDYECRTFVERVESMTLFVLKKTDLLNSFFFLISIDIMGVKNVTATVYVLDVFLNIF